MLYFLQENKFISQSYYYIIIYSTWYEHIVSNNIDRYEVKTEDRCTEYPIIIAWGRAKCQNNNNLLKICNHHNFFLFPIFEFSECFQMVGRFI